MRKVSSAIVKMIVVLVAVFSLIIAANAGYVTNTNNDLKTPPVMTTQIEFYANITFNVFVGDGCGCVPLWEVPLNATGRDTDHSTSGITDDDGNCVLPLEYDKTYRISIQKKDFESVLFDFVVIDDQVFSFHMKELDVSSHPVSVIQMMLQRILLSKRFITQVGL